MKRRDEPDLAAVLADLSRHLTPQERRDRRLAEAIDLVGRAAERKRQVMEFQRQLDRQRGRRTVRRSGGGGSAATCMAMPPTRHALARRQAAGYPHRPRNLT